MKLTPRRKKIFMVAALVFAAVILTGCAIPRDANNQIIYIWNEQVEGYTVRTSFADVMKNENWFNAIFVYPLSAIINKLAPVLSVGGAIALVTIIINAILAVATIKSTIASQQMQLIQPELERIQRKYEGRDDQASKMRQAQEMQALYAKYKINPASVMLVTFIQLPVIMAMYMSVQRSFAVATGSFLGMDLQMTPMSGFQALFKGDTSLIALVLLWIVMGLSQFAAMRIPMIIQQKRAEAEAKKHHRRYEKPKSQNMVMQIYMMGMICVFGLMWPAAMSLYWAISSCVNIVKTLVVQQIIDKQNAAGGAR
ncbi:MAG: YidC/Oxa1 family membrane protein insertase [Erysipelotrichaceae bacterium]|nr:YidC/Oxa1 family membrane protein insertase [Erysipelotrichaceae bacterium]